jgi:excisionase family DNA binding protein
MSNEIMNVQQLAEFLGAPVHTIHGLTRKRSRMRHENPLPHVRIGKRLYFRRETVEAWIKANEEESVAWNKVQRL